MYQRMGVRPASAPEHLARPYSHLANYTLRKFGAKGLLDFPVRKRSVVICWYVTGYRKKCGYLPIWDQIQKKVWSSVNKVLLTWKSAYSAPPPPHVMVHVVPPIPSPGAT